MEDQIKTGNQITKVVIGIIILIIVIVFSLQNSVSTPVKFISFEGQAPLVLLFMLCFTAGLVSAIIFIWPVNRHSKRKDKLITELKNRIDLLEKNSKF